MSLLNSIGSSLDRFLARFHLRSFQARRFRKRERYRPDYEILGQALLRSIHFQSMFDVGCANGFLLEYFHRAGKDVAGIDVSPDVRSVLSAHLLPRVQIGDFSQAHGKYDFVCCVEVAEHLPPKRSEELVEKLISLADSAIYFSAAPPGQLGYGHINCRPPHDWLNFFADRGWVSEEEQTTQLRTALRAVGRAHWLRRNSFLMVPAQRPKGVIVNGAGAGPVARRDNTAVRR